MGDYLCLFFKKMCKIVGIYFHCMLIVHKKTDKIFILIII